MIDITGKFREKIHHLSPRWMDPNLCHSAAPAGIDGCPAEGFAVPIVVVVDVRGSQVTYKKNAQKGQLNETCMIRPFVGDKP